MQFRRFLPWLSLLAAAVNAAAAYTADKAAPRALWAAGSVVMFVNAALWWWHLRRNPVPPSRGKHAR